MVGAQELPVNSAGNFSHLLLVIESLPPELLVEEQPKAVRLVHLFPDVFSCSEFDLGRTSLITHHIDTGEANPFRQGLQRHPDV